MDLIIFIFIQLARETVERQATSNRVDHAMLEKSVRLMVTVQVSQFISYSKSEDFTQSLYIFFYCHEIFLFLWNNATT